MEQTAPRAIRENTRESGPLRTPFPRTAVAFGGKWQGIFSAMWRRISVILEG